MSMTYDARMSNPKTHELTVWNAVDVPDDVKAEVDALLMRFDMDTYARACDAEGRTS